MKGRERKEKLEEEEKIGIENPNKTIHTRNKPKKGGEGKQKRVPKIDTYIMKMTLKDTNHNLPSYISHEH